MSHVLLPFELSDDTVMLKSSFESVDSLAHETGAIGIILVPEINGIYLSKELL